MKTKYRTSSFSYEPTIKAVEIEKESEHSVWIKGNVCRKISNYEQFHDTFEDARKYLIDKFENKIELAQGQIKNLAEWIEEYQQELLKIKEMQP